MATTTMDRDIITTATRCMINHTIMIPMPSGAGSGP